MIPIVKMVVRKIVLRVARANAPTTVLILAVRIVLEAAEGAVETVVKAVANLPVETR